MDGEKKRTGETEEIVTLERRKTRTSQTEKETDRGKKDDVDATGKKK